MYTIDPTYCAWDTSSTFLLFSENVFGNFIYYSHLLPIICLALLGFVLVWQNFSSPSVRALILMSLAFAAWSLSDLVLWATANPSHTMFFWSIIIHFELLIYIAALYFIYYFISGKGPSLKVELGILVAYLPVAFLAHTGLNLTGFDYTNCYREALEGPLLTYVYSFEIVLALWIFAYGVRWAHAVQGKRRTTEVILATLSVVLFLASFSLGNIIGTLEIDWEMGQYGLFGLPIFVAILTYLIIRYHSFNTKLFAAQALVAAIFILIVSMLLVRQIQNIQIITVVTALLTLFLGYLLVRSVKREIEQRRKVEQLVSDLEHANNRLKELDKLKTEFVSIASHQLRSPLAAVKGYASMLLEGSFGELTVGAKEAVGRIFSSSAFMARSVDDFLNVSRIELGRMKYDLSTFDICNLIDLVIDEQKPFALDKKLELTRAKDEGVKTCEIYADMGKVKQVLTNLVDNAIKYTKEGSITVSFKRDTPKRTVTIWIKDTGMGMSEETIGKLFKKFSRADNANKVNVIGTGLGLYVAHNLITAQGGKLWAESEGEGKGSTFCIELPDASQGTPSK